MQPDILETLRRNQEKHLQRAQEASKNQAGDTIIVESLVNYFANTPNRAIQKDPAQFITEEMQQLEGIDRPDLSDRVIEQYLFLLEQEK